jgi:hypothetical protein
MTAAWQWRRLVSATWLTAGIGLVATSCSFLFELDANQCSVDADCEKFEGERPVCDAGLCKAKADPGGNGGSSTAGTAGAPPTDAGAGGAVETGCKSNKECLETSGYEPHVCIDGECVGLITDDCPVVIGEENLEAEEPIIFGAYTLGDAVNRSVAMRNIDLAVSEFTEKVTGLPGGPNGSDRTLAFVVCKSSYPEVAPGTIDPFEPSLEHLVDTLDVPGILSGLSAKNMEAVFAQRLNEAGTFVISPYEQDTELAAFSDGGRLWHLLGATADLAPTFGPLLKRTEAYLRTNAFLNLGGDDKLRVAIVTANIARETDVRDALVGLPELADFNFKLFAVDSALLTASPETASVAIGLLDYAPNIIVALAGSEFIQDIFPALEAEDTWGVAGTPTNGQSRPMYLLGAAMAPETWFLYSAKDPQEGGYGSLLDRIVGVTYESAEDTELLDEYTLRLVSENQDLPDTSILAGSENVYDAAYLLIYAAAAAGEVPELNGTEMSRGMRDLLGGEEFNVGPKDISSVLGTLQRGDEVGLRLTLGEPNWNEGRGTRKGRGSVYCFNDNDSIREREFGPKGPVNDVLRYDPENNTLYDPETDTVEGELLCIPGF